VNGVPAPQPRVHLPSLSLALLAMIFGTVYPPLMIDAAGRPDHALAGLLLWAMSAGFVHGVGFAPRFPALRWLLSGWACALAAAAFLLLRFVR
jgi:predicted membrane protein